MTTRFVDSAYAPNASQVQAAIQEGITAWAFYLEGPGAYHNWSVAEVDVLRQGGLQKGLPVYVPAINLQGNPVADATAFVAAMTAAGVYGVGALDTEASMRGNPHLHSYVDGFTDHLVELGVTPVVYAGGTYVPPGDHAWWIIPGGTAAPPGTAYQVGSGSLAGLSVDFDVAGVGFPFASLATAPPPAPPTPKEGTSMIASPSSGQGYAAAKPTGAVYCYGTVGYHGGANAGGNPAHPTHADLGAGDTIVGIALCETVQLALAPKEGTALATAALHNGKLTTTAEAVLTSVGATLTTTVTGYWLYAASGAVFAYGAAQYLGGPNASTPAPNEGKR